MSLYYLSYSLSVGIDLMNFLYSSGVSISFESVFDGVVGSLLNLVSVNISSAVKYFMSADLVVRCIPGLGYSLLLN